MARLGSDSVMAGQSYGDRAGCDVEGWMGCQCADGGQDQAK